MRWARFGDQQMTIDTDQTTDIEQESPSHGLQAMMTREDCANLLRVRPKTITRMVQDGRFPDPVISAHRLVRWDPGHVERFLRTGKVR